MPLSYKARRRWSMILLLVGLPIYIVLAWVLLSWLGRPSVLVELLVYLVLGVAWAVPFRFVFRGVGKQDPDANRPAVGERAAERASSSRPDA